MRPGDTVYTAPGEWHWHGAAPVTHTCKADSKSRGPLSALAAVSKMTS
jgi:quercetin dioxygenase-like cupin family protein